MPSEEHGEHPERETRRDEIDARRVIERGECEANKGEDQKNEGEHDGLNLLLCEMGHEGWKLLAAIEAAISPLVRPTNACTTTEPRLKLIAD